MWANGMKAFRVTRTKVASRLRLGGKQPKVTVSAPTRVTILLECCKMMSKCNRLDYPLIVCSFGGVGT
jgi:hypothetical protein